MKISLDWLREYAALDAPVSTLVKALVDTGTEVDRVHRGPEGVVVARVVALSDVPESDKGVRFADIDLGERQLRVLTGAANVKAGDLVPYAPPGTLLPGWTEPLGVRTMFRKYESPGMLCSAAEVGTGDDAAGLLILESGTPGQPIHELLPVDVVLEVDVTTNRPDCLCHIGIARELTAALAEDLRLPDCSVPQRLLSSVALEGRASVRVEATDGCPRFMLRLIEGVTVQPSPPWLRRRLQSIGLRPINNVVDITNFVAHELGQPLHAFDADRFADLAGGHADVVVRRARDGERLQCLDGSERELSHDDLVVCAGDVAASLAGIMGGSASAVGDTTTRVLLESATWTGPIIRATSKRLGLRSDASTLFEKGLSDSVPPLALDRAAALIAEHGSGHVLDGLLDVHSAPLPVIPAIEISASRLSQLLGCPTDATEAATALVRLGFEVEQSGDRLLATVPDFRRDVTIPEDLVEEVGRSLGYDRIPGTLPGRRTVVSRLAPELAAEDRTRDLLIGAGFDEAITWSFTSHALAASIAGCGEARQPIAVLNPLSEEWAVMRTSCLPGLASALAGNLNRGVAHVWLFEIGRAFWEGERRHPPAGSMGDAVDASLTPLPAEPLLLSMVMHADDAASSATALRHLHATIEAVSRDLAGHGVSVVPEKIAGLRPGRSARILQGTIAIGQLGELDSETLEGLELRGRVVVAELRLDSLIPERPRAIHYHQPPRFPAVVHDLAVVVSRDVMAAQGLSAIRDAGGLLLESVELFDEFHGDSIGEQRKGWTFRLTFRAHDRTLRADEAEVVQQAIAVALRARCGADIRA